MANDGNCQFRSFAHRPSLAVLFFFTPFFDSIGGGGHPEAFSKI